MKRVVMVMGVALSLAAWAMPTEDEIAKVTPVVQELAKGDYADLKAGRKSPEQVAETLIGYVKDAEREAAKCVLIGRAFDLYLEHGPLSKARDVANEMLPSHVRGCDLSVFNERLGCAFAAKDQWDYAFMSFKRCGGKMAEIVAWEKAYPETGITELTTGAVGDFWWELSEKYADSPKVAAALRAHSVRWLKEALKNNSLRGLKRTLASKRIAEVEKEGGCVQPPVSAPSSRTSCDDSSRVDDASRAADAPSANQDSKLSNWDDWVRASAVKITKPAGKPITLNLGKGAKLEFIGCPAGEFMMGRAYMNESSPKDEGANSESACYRHMVKITRPFWLAKYKTTHEMWNAYQKVVLTKEDLALGGMKRVHLVPYPEVWDFCEWLTKKHRRSLPPGYVFRVPTEAEWEFAYRGDTIDDNDLYLRSYGVQGDPKRMPNEFSKIMVWWDDDVLPKLQRVRSARFGNPEHPEGGISGAEVGTKRPNAWGLYDMIGNCGEMTLDVIERSGWNLKSRSISGVSPYVSQTVVKYGKTEVDPLRYATNSGGEKAPLLRGGNRANLWRYFPANKTIPVATSLCYPFRVCIGPDLIKEKGFKKIDWSKIKGQSSSGGNSKRK